MTDSAPRPRRFLSRKQLADRWGRSTRTIVRWGEDEEMNLPAEYLLGREPLRDEAEIEAWELSRKVEKPATTKPTKPMKPAQRELPAPGRKQVAGEARGRGV